MSMRKYPDYRLPVDRAADQRERPPARPTMSDSADRIYATIRTPTDWERRKAAARLVKVAPDLIEMLGLEDEAAAYHGMSAA